MLDDYEVAMNKGASDVNAEIIARRKRAEDVVGGALVEGDKGAYDKLREAAKAHPDKFTHDQQLAIEDASPESFEQELRNAADLERVRQMGKDDREKAAENKKKADDAQQAKDQADREHDAEVKATASQFGAAFGGSDPDSIETAIAPDRQWREQRGHLAQVVPERQGSAC